jgi:hypothetical protein
MNSNCNPCSPNPSADPVRNATAAPASRALGAFLVAAALFTCGGCSTMGAKPWEHDLLAEHAMQVDPYPLQTSIDDHIYFSKEASSGGRSFAGGGCGCN